MFLLLLEQHISHYCRDLPLFNFFPTNNSYQELRQFTVLILFLSFILIFSSIYLCNFVVPKKDNIMNEIKFYPAMVRNGESHRNAVICVRTPVAGFLFIPKKITLCINSVNPSASRMLVG